MVKDEEEYFSIGEVKQQNLNSVDLININTASADELVELPNIGETRASAIIEYRNQNGPFTDIAEIINVSGIGEVTYNLIKDLITIY